MWLKGLIDAAFESFEPFHLLRLNGRVGAIPTQRVSDCIHVYGTHVALFQPYSLHK